MSTQESTTQRAKPSEIREFFNCPERGKPTLNEMKALKDSESDYDAIANGIGNGSLTY